MPRRRFFGRRRPSSALRRLRIICIVFDAVLYLKVQNLYITGLRPAVALRATLASLALAAFGRLPAAQRVFTCPSGKMRLRRKHLRCNLKFYQAFGLIPPFGRYLALRASACGAASFNCPSGSARFARFAPSALSVSYLPF